MQVYLKTNPHYTFLFNGMTCLSLITLWFLFCISLLSWWSRSSALISPGHFSQRDAARGDKIALSRKADKGGELVRWPGARAGRMASRKVYCRSFAAVVAPEAAASAIRALFLPHFLRWGRMMARTNSVKTRFLPAAEPSGLWIVKLFCPWPWPHISQNA